MYITLAERFGYTPQEISEMTYSQQVMLLKGKSFTTFRSMQEFMSWMAGR